jgi:hypothetical protein
MRKRLICIIIFSLSTFLLLPASQIEASAQSPAVDAILDSAEQFFVSLKELDFQSAWNMLSAKSRHKIVTDVYETSVKIGATLRREDIIRDFEQHGVMFRNYWESFLRNFDTDIVLEQSLWKMGAIEETEAEIIIQYNKSGNPTVLRMFKENDAWKVGLKETFSRGTAKKWFDYLKIMHGI